MVHEACVICDLCATDENTRNATGRTCPWAQVEPSRARTASTRADRSRRGEYQIQMLSRDEFVIPALGTRARSRAEMIGPGSRVCARSRKGSPGLYAAANL